MNDEDIEKIKAKVSTVSNDELMSQIKNIKSSDSAKDSILNKLNDNPELKSKLDNFFNKK